MSRECALNAARHEQGVFRHIPSGFWTGILQVLAFSLLNLCLQDGPALLLTVWLCFCWPAAPCLVF